MIIILHVEENILGILKIISKLIIQYKTTKVTQESIKNETIFTILNTTVKIWQYETIL